MPMHQSQCLKLLLDGDSTIRTLPVAVARWGKWAGDSSVENVRGGGGVEIPSNFEAWDVRFRRGQTFAMAATTNAGSDTREEEKRKTTYFVVNYLRLGRGGLWWEPVSRQAAEMISRIGRGSSSFRRVVLRGGRGREQRRRCVGENTYLPWLICPET